MLRKAFTFLVIGSILVAIWRAVPWENPAAAWAMLKDASADFGQFIDHIVNLLGLNDLPEVENPIVLDPTA